MKITYSILIFHWPSVFYPLGLLFNTLCPCPWDVCNRPSTVDYVNLAYYIHQLATSLFHIN